MRLDDIENDYRQGTMTNVYIGKRNDVSEAYVRKVAKKYGWVKGEPRKVKPPLPEFYKEVIKKPLSESIDANNNVKLTFMFMDLTERMLDELHQITTYQGELEALILAETGDDRNAKTRLAMLKAVSLTARVNILKTIVQITVDTRGIVLPCVNSGRKKKANTFEAKDALKEKVVPTAVYIR